MSKIVLHETTTIPFPEANRAIITVRNNTMFLMFEDGSEYPLVISGSTPYILLDPQTSDPAHQEGIVYYSDITKTLNLCTDSPDVTMNIGRELWVRAYNNTGTNIPNGSVVYVTGAHSKKPTIALAQAGTVPADCILGITTHTVLAASEGEVTTFGEVSDIDTSAYVEGSVLYLSTSTPGALTDIAPANGTTIAIATCLYSHPNEGKLKVCIKDSNDYQLKLIGGTNIKTINGINLLGAGNISVGTVTEVGLSVPTGFTTTGSPVSTSGTISLVFQAGYSLPTDFSQANWNTAFSWGNHASANYVLTIDGQSAIAGDISLTNSYEAKRQNNLTATTDPTVTDDNTVGYEPLSRWVNTVTGEIWLCISAATGAANWQQATLTIDELGSAALVDVGTGPGQIPTTGDYDPSGSAAAAQAYSIQRGNHTGTQPLSTISDAGTAAGANVEDFEARLSSIVAEKAITAVDVFVYDTSRDSDGGAWRNRCQHTSWYNEPLNTATRGSRKEFPAVAVIVLSGTGNSIRVDVYDGDDPSLPLWAKIVNCLPRYSATQLSSVSAQNGIISIGVKAGYSGIARLSLPLSRNIWVGSGQGGFPIGVYTQDNWDTTMYHPTPSNSTFVSGSILVNQVVNDVAMTVLPNAPVDPTTGLQIPTIAVATDGGVSVIKDDGSVVDITYNDGSSYSSINFFDDGDIGYEVASFYRKQSIPDADLNLGLRYVKKPQDKLFYPFVKNGAYVGADAYLGDTNTSTAFFDTVPIAASSSNKLFKFDPYSPKLHSYITSSYNTGWMHGDIKGAWLADTTAESITGGTVADRSVNANPLNVVGALTKSPVATGSELVAYSGFSATNYLEQPYNPDLDFGTGDFYVMGWVNTSASADFQKIFDRRVYGNADNWFALALGPGESPYFYTRGVATALNASASSPLPLGQYSLLAGVRDSSGCYLYVNGRLVASALGAPQDVTNTSATLRVGSDNGASIDNVLGSLALWRIGAGAPTADQIKKIYEDEKVLFQENTACTLYGSSDAVTAIAHDSVTDLLHVGTSAGRSVFQGLRRVDHTTEPVTAAISAVDGFVVEG